MLEEDGNVSDSTVLLDDYQHNPDKIAAKRRKLAAKYVVGALVNSENAAHDGDNDTSNIQTDNANSNSANVLGENNRPEYQQWRVNKYFSSMDNAQKANEDDSRKDLEIKRELLKQEAYSNQSEDINEQNLSNHFGYDSNEEDDGVIVIEDSDDDCVAYETRENNQVENTQASSVVLSGRYDDKFSNVSRAHPKPSAINARRATINHYENNETPLNLTKMQCNQPRLRVLLPATINARRATVDISELMENRRIETDINNETEDSREKKTVKQREPGVNIAPVVSETSDVTNETNIVIEDRQSKDETCLKPTHASKCDMKTDTDIIIDSFAVDKGNKRAIFNPELTLSHQNNNNVITQRTPHEHKAKSDKDDKKTQIDCDENTTVNNTNDDNLCNIGVDSSAQLTHRSDLNSSFKNTNTRGVINIYINANEISRKRLSIDITSEDTQTTKIIGHSTDQSNNVERSKNTETNDSTEKEDIQMETNDGPVIDASNKNESNNEANNQSVIDTNVGNSKEALSYGEFESLIKFQVDFCTYLRGNVLNHSKIHRNDVKVKSYLKSAESLANEIERLKALAYDRGVKADIQYVCPVCTCISTYSASRLFRNNDNHTNVETNGIKCEFCRGTGTLYNSYMKKFLQEDNARRNRSKVESYVNDKNPVEEVPGRESLNHSKESNNTVDSVSETDTLNTCKVKQYNNSKLGSMTSSEAIVESNKLTESQCNLNSKQRNITASVETNTSKDSLKDVSPRERSVLNVTKDNTDDSESTNNSLTKSTNSAIVRNTDVPDTLIELSVDKNNKMTNNKQESTAKEADNTFEKSPFEVTSSNIVSTTVNNDNENLGMIDNFDSDRLSNEETNKFQSTTSVDTRTNVTTDRLLNSEINDSFCTENLVTDGTVISKFFCKRKNDSIKIGSTNLKRKINEHGSKMFFKRKRPNVVTEIKDLSNSPEDCNVSNICGNIGDRRSHMQNNNAKPNELSLDETTETHTEEQNINDASNKSSDSIQQTLENNEKYSKSKDKTRENLDKSDTNKSNELNKKTILKHRDNQTLPSNHEHNDTEYDADTEDQNIGIASTITDVGIKNKLRVRGVNKKGGSINNVNKEQLESRKEKEKTKTSEGFNVSDKRRQDENDKSRRINETNHEDDCETRTADTEDEGKENSTIDSDASGGESNNTLRKTLEESFKKIKRNLNMTAPPTPHVTISNENPPKDCENKVSNRNKLDIKCQIQYMCNICTCVFVYGGRFLRHMIKNHNMDLKKIPKQCIASKCSFCRVFLKENAINLHVQKFHSNEYLKHGDAIKSKKNTKVIKQKNVVKDVNNVKWIRKDGNWRYVCSICNVTINSEYAARKHKKDKHPNMKNRKLYEKVSIEEIHASNVEKPHKTSGARGSKNTKNDTDEIGRDSEHDPNEDCENSEDGSWKHETDDGTDNDQNTSNHDSNSEDNCEQSPRGSSFEDKDDSCGDDTDAEYEKSSGSESNPPQINENDQENMQEILELSDDEDRGPTNKDNSDMRSSSDDDIEYDTSHRSEDGSSEHETDDHTDKKNTKAIKQKNVFKDVNKVRWITKDGNWRYVCSICNVTINSEYAARKHKKDKHPNMKNRKLYDKVSIEEIHASSVEEVHKTSGGDRVLKNAKNDTDEIGKDSEHDTNEDCENSEDGSWNYETDNDQNTSNHDNDDQSPRSSSFEDKDRSFGDNTDAECNKSSGAVPNPPQINKNDQENMQEMLELSDDEDNGTTNQDDSDWRSCSDDDMEFDTGNSKEDASSDEGEINRHDLGHESYGRTKLRVNDINAPRVGKKQTAANIQKVKYYFECIICEVRLDSHYAVRKHRKEKHPDLKKKKLVYKIFKSEYGKLNVEKNDDHLDYEKEQTTRDEYRSDLNSCSGYTDESNSGSEYDIDELSGEERNVIIESNQSSAAISSEEEVDDNNDSEPEATKNDDSSDKNNEVNDEQDIANKNLSGDDYSGINKKCHEKGETINEDYHEISGNNLRLDNIDKKSKRRKNHLYTYECTACKVTLDSEYAVRKHRKDKHRNERKKKLIRKFLTVVKNQPNIVQSNDEKVQRTNVDNMRDEENISHKTGNENINNDNNMDNRNDVNMSRFDEIPEQCIDSRHKINEKSHNPSINDHIEDNLKNDRSENHTRDKSSENATTALRSDYETFIEDGMRLVKNIDKNIDRGKNIINSINNKKNPSANNAHKCILCKEYFQSFHFMRIHRESKHPFMKNVKIFEKVVITNFAKEENSSKDVECRVEEASKANNVTNKEIQGVTDISTVPKSTKPSDDSGSKDSRKNVIRDEAVKTDENVQNADENGKEQAYARVHQKNNDVNNTDKSISNKNSSNLKDQDNKLENKNANKNNQNHKENNGNSSDAKPRYSNCYDCAINFDVNEQHDHICTLRKEKDVFYNCYACGVNFVNNIEHLCSKKRGAWIENIQISNVVTVKDSYVFSCVECKYSTDLYDDVVKHCQNHYLEIVDAVTYCEVCRLNFDEHRYSTHHNLHAKFELINYSYKSLFSNWDVIFDDIPRDVAMVLKTQSIYTTHSIRMAKAEEGPKEYSLYQCDQCNSCVPKPEIEKHCLSQCSEMNYICSVCDRAFLSYEMCVNHEVTHRNGAKIFRIIAFNRKEDRKFNLKLIEARELQMKRSKSPRKLQNAPTAELFMCQCDLCFTCTENFKIHFLECNSSRQNGILCSKCHVKRIFLANELDRHLQLHHAEVIYEFVINQINITRSIEPNEVKCDETTQHNEPASTELNAEVHLKKALLKQEDDAIVISDDDDV